MNKIAAGVLAVSLIGFGVFILKDDVETSVVAQKEIVHPSEDVTNHFGQLTVNGYEWIEEDIHWLNEESVLFRGRHSTEEAITYRLNTESLALEESAEDLHRQGIEMVYENHESKIYLEQDASSLNVYRQEGVQQIKDKVNLETPYQVKLSKNQDKLAFVEKNSNVLEVYDVSSDRNKHILSPFEGEASKALISGTVFSDDGGFLSIAKTSQPLTESRFYIYGADSGRVYGNHIKGIEPVFSPDSKTLAYIYSGEMDGSYAGGKIGLFVLKYKSMTYLDTLVEGTFYLPKLAWSEDSRFLYCLVSNGSTSYQLMKVDVKNGQMSGLGIDLNDEIRSLEAFLVVKERVYFSYNKGKLCEVDMATGRYNSMEGLMPLNDTDDYLQLVASDHVLIHHNNHLKTLNSSHQENIMSYNGQLLGVYPSPLESKLCLLLKDQDEMRLQIAPLLK